MKFEDIQVEKMYSHTAISSLVLFFVHQKDDNSMTGMLVYISSAESSCGERTIQKDKWHIRRFIWHSLRLNPGVSKNIIFKQVFQ